MFILNSLYFRPHGACTLLYPSWALSFTLSLVSSSFTLAFMGLAFDYWYWLSIVMIWWYLVLVCRRCWWYWCLKGTKDILIWWWCLARLEDWWCPTRLEDDSWCAYVHVYQFESGYLYVWNILICMMMSDKDKGYVSRP